jgi:hypothetical protein
MKKDSGRRCPHRHGEGLWRGDEDVTTPSLSGEAMSSSPWGWVLEGRRGRHHSVRKRGGDVLIATGMGFGGATGTSPLRPKAGRRCPHRHGDGFWRGDEDVTTPSESGAAMSSSPRGWVLEGRRGRHHSVLERGGDVLIAMGMGFGGATGTSPPRSGSVRGQAIGLGSGG